MSISKKLDIFMINHISEEKIICIKEFTHKTSEGEICTLVKYSSNKHIYFRLFDSLDRLCSTFDDNSPFQINIINTNFQSIKDQRKEKLQKLSKLEKI